MAGRKTSDLLRECINGSSQSNSMITEVVQCYAAITTCLNGVAVKRTPKFPVCSSKNQGSVTDATVPDRWTQPGNQPLVDFASQNASIALQPAGRDSIFSISNYVGLLSSQTVERCKGSEK